MVTAVCIYFLMNDDRRCCCCNAKLKHSLISLKRRVSAHKLCWNVPFTLKDVSAHHSFVSVSHCSKILKILIPMLSLHPSAACISGKLFRAAVGHSMNEINDMKIAQVLLSLFTYPKCCDVVALYTFYFEGEKIYTYHSTFLQKATFQQQGAEEKTRTGECVYDLVKHPRHDWLDGKVPTILGTKLRIQHRRYSLTLIDWVKATLCNFFPP